jgi:hypothetical protein
LVIKPACKVPPELKARLRDNKAEILRRLELESSMQRVASAGICIAVWQDGSMQVSISEPEHRQARIDGGTVYMHSFKCMFGGTTEWKDPRQKESHRAATHEKQHKN